MTDAIETTEELNVGAVATRDIDPDKVEISMVLRETQKTITDWLDYSFNDNFLTPVCGFSFTVGGFGFRQLWDAGVRPGARVSLRLAEHYVGDGYIDSLEISADRGGGISARIEGRDRLSYAVDSNARPKLAFKEGTTLGEAVKQILEPYGFSKIVIDNDANVQLQTGVVSGIKYTKGGGKKGPKPLTSFVLHHSKPYPGEGAFAFAQRLAQRHGVWLWLSADGESVIASRPNFDREPTHSLFRYIDGPSNVVGGSVKYDVGEQPTLIIADGLGAGGEFGHSRLRAKMMNPATNTDDPELPRVWIEYADAKIVEMGAVGTPMYVPKCRTVYLHDQSSQTPKQLENFVKREMSLAVRKSLQVSYTVLGHGQMVNDTFVPWAVDTMVAVDDEVAGLQETLWVVGRTFTRSRQNGTMTKLDLVRAHSLELGEADAEQVAAKKPSKPRAKSEEQVREESAQLDAEILANLRRAKYD